MRADAEGTVGVALNGASMRLQPALPWRAGYPLTAAFSNGLLLELPRVVRSSANVVEMTYAATYQDDGDTSAHAPTASRTTKETAMPRTKPP